MHDRLTSHLKTYLRAIAEVSRDRGAARASAIAGRLGVTRASVTGALRALAAQGLVRYVPYHPVVLTEGGLSLTQIMDGRREVLSRFFQVLLGLSGDEAEAAAAQAEAGAHPAVLTRMLEVATLWDQCRRPRWTWDPQGRLRCLAGTLGPACTGCARRADS